MHSLRLPIVLASLATLLAAKGAAADERPNDTTGQQTPSPLPAPTPPGTPGSTTVVAPPGSGGVTVVAPTPGGGSVTASGCSTVTVAGQPTLVGPDGQPCPTLAPYQPYAAPAPPPVYDVRPKYARDPERSGALIGSSIVFGVGTAVSGIVYLIQHAKENDSCGATKSDWRSGQTYVDNSGCGSSRASLMTYGAIVTLLPSVPRFVVGDTNGGLLFSGIRVASFGTAVLVNWGKSSETSWQGPFLLGFAIPLTLGIVDLATTPHREDLEPKTAKPGVTSVSPVAVNDVNGKTHGALLSVGGIF